MFEYNSGVERSTMKIFYEENICVRCLACVSESEFGGVTCAGDRIHFDEMKPEDWENIAAICPVGAINLRRSSDWTQQRLYTF